MFCRPTLCSKLFPTIGFRIITELSSPEDLPDLETDKLSNERLESRSDCRNSKPFLNVSSHTLLLDALGLVMFNPRPECGQSAISPESRSNGPWPGSGVSHQHRVVRRQKLLQFPDDTDGLAGDRSLERRNHEPVVNQESADMADLYET
jgi:hypothetical protein